MSPDIGGHDLPHNRPGHGGPEGRHPVEPHLGGPARPGRPPKGPRGGAWLDSRDLTGHLNSLATETLLENVHRLRSSDDIRDFLLEDQPESIDLLNHVLELGFGTPRQVVYEYALREAEIGLQTRRLLLTDVGGESAAVFLPLPPHVIRLIRHELDRLPCYNTEDRRPNHLRDIPQQVLRGGVLADAFERLREASTVVLDGQWVSGNLYVRSAVAPLISSVLDRSLRRIFLHRIPHLPPGQEFSHVAVDVDRIDVRYI